MKDFRQLKVWEKSHLLVYKEHYDKLNVDVTEIKRMLASLLKTLRADR